LVLVSPALRYYVLLEGDTDRADDDLLVDVKESRDGLQLSLPHQFASSQWNSNGERSVANQRAAHSVKLGDPLLGWATTGPVSYRVFSRTGYQRGLSVVDVQSLLSTSDGRSRVLKLANTFGVMLANAHGTTATASGSRGAAVIALLVQGRSREFGTELTQFVIGYAEQTLTDYRQAVASDLSNAPEFAP
jgi:uncharacterized protein (DUF2252 family)